MSDQEAIQPIEATAVRAPRVPLLPGKIPTGSYKGEPVFKPVSSATHERMHQSLALAAGKGYRSIPCEVCGESSGSINGTVDTREVEGMLRAVAELPTPEDELPFFGERSVQPHRQRLYPDLPKGWERMTFDTLTIDDGNREIATIAQAWIEMPGGVLVLLGPTGVGKTHLLSAMVHELIGKNADTSAWEFDEWHSTLRGVFDSGREEIEAFEHRMIRCGFWVIDDIRAEKTSDGVREMFEKVVHRRTQEGRPILLTTNASEEEWMTWSSRSYSRLRARAYATWLPMMDRDRRLVA